MTPNGISVGDIASGRSVAPYLRNCQPDTESVLLFLALLIREYLQRVAKLDAELLKIEQSLSNNQWRSVISTPREKEIRVLVERIRILAKITPSDVEKIIAQFMRSMIAFQSQAPVGMVACVDDIIPHVCCWTCKSQYVVNTVLDAYHDYRDSLDKK
jgi:hypothetical protein